MLTLCFCVLDHFRLGSRNVLVCLYVDVFLLVQMEMDGGEAKSNFGGSNKRARTAAASEWDSQVFSDDEAEADVRTKLGAATLSGATRNARSAGMVCFQVQQVWRDVGACAWLLHMSLQQTCTQFVKVCANVTSAHCCSLSIELLVVMRQPGTYTLARTAQPIASLFLESSTAGCLQRHWSTVLPGQNCVY